MSWVCCAPGASDRAFRPLPSQYEFQTSESYATFFAGGWGSGKSLALVNWLMHRAAANPPGTTGMVIMPTYELMQSMIETLLLPAWMYVVQGRSVAQRCIYLPGNRRLLYRSGHVPERIEFYNLAYAGLDEAGLMDRSIFYRIAARVRDPAASCRQIGITGTPLWGWLQDEFQDRNDADRRIIHAKTADNIHLDAEYLRTLRDACPRRLQSCYIEGDFVPPGDVVYAEYDPHKHIIDYKPTGGAVLCAVDWSPRTPHVLFAERLTDGKSMVVFDEIVAADLTVKKLCALIKQRGYALREFCCDPAGAAVEATSGTDQITEAQIELGIRAVYRRDHAGRSVINGINHVRNMLEPLDGQPRLFFARALDLKTKAIQERHLRQRCVLEAIIAYAYKPLDGRVRTALDIPIKDGVTDHAMDCLRYLAVNYFPQARLLATVHLGK